MIGRPESTFRYPTVKVFYNKVSVKGFPYMRTILYFYRDCVDRMRLEKGQQFTIKPTPDGFTMHPLHGNSILSIYFTVGATRGYTLKIETQKYHTILNEGMYKLTEYTKDCFTFKRY